MTYLQSFCFPTLLFLFATLNSASSQSIAITPVTYNAWSEVNALGHKADQDHDKDGVLNGIEYFMGESGNTQTITPLVKNQIITWPMVSTYAGEYGADYTVETSTDLSTWSVAPIGSSPGTVAIIGGHSVAYTMPSKLSKIFARLSVVIGTIQVPAIPSGYFDSIVDGDTAEQWRPLMANSPISALSPTIGFTGTTYQPFIAGVQQSAYHHFQFRGGVFVRGGSAANDWDVARPSKITGRFLSLPAAIEFSTSSPIVAFRVMAGTIGLSSITPWVSQNGGRYELIQSTPIYTTVTAGSYETLRLTFPTAAPRKFKFELSNTNGFSLVRVPEGESISKPDTTLKRVIVLGDSFTQGTGVTNGHIWTGWASRLSHKFPTWDVWASGAGGTGYRNSGPAGQFKIFDRLQSDCIDFKPDMIIWALGINDTRSDLYASNGVYSEARLCYSTVKTALPNCTQVVFGPWWNFAGPTADATAVHEQLRTAAADEGLVFIPTLDLPGRWIQANNRESYHPTIAARGVVTRNGNTLESIAVTNGGRGYQARPAVSFSGGNGSGAVAIANMDGRIESVSLLASGNDYTSPSIRILGGGGEGATATATVNEGKITSITILSQGTGYTAQPIIEISDPTGRGAKAVAAYALQVVSVTINQAGSGYTTTPTVNFSAPSDTVHPTRIGHGYYAERAAYELQKFGG